MKGHKALFYEEWFVIFRAVLISASAFIGARIIERLPVVTIILFFFCGTFVAIDWGMGLESHWSSNIYGLLWLVTFAYAFFAIVTSVRCETVGPKDRKDLAHILITLAIMWGYLQYSQFIILWMGNKPSEVKFYVERHFPFGTMVAILIFKLVPVFGVGFFPTLKEEPKILRIVSAFILIGTWIELEWLLGPPLQMAIIPGLVGAAAFLILLSGAGILARRLV
jgi:hypothetical protein